MSMRGKKLVGGFVMIVFVIVYALLAMALAQARPIQEANTLLRTLFFAVLGFGWVLPLLPLIRWMERTRG